MKAPMNLKAMEHFLGDFTSSAHVAMDLDKIIQEFTRVSQYSDYFEAKELADYISRLFYLRGVFLKTALDNNEPLKDERLEELLKI